MSEIDGDVATFWPLPSVRHLRILARTVGTGDTQVYVRDGVPEKSVTLGGDPR